MKKLLIISTNWPAPNYSAAGVRLMQLVEFFKEEDYQITLASTAAMAAVLDSNFKDVEWVPIKLNDASFDSFLIGLGPNVVVFDRFMAEEQFGWRVAEHTPSALRILDTEDLHSLRGTREEALKAKIDFSNTLWLQNDSTKREIASIYRCDLSLIISSFEMDLLTKVIGIDDSILLHLPFMSDSLDESVSTAWKTFEERKDFVFIGFGGHSPNVDAIHYLKTEIWPFIKENLPTVKLNIYGGNFPKKIKQLHNEDEGFLIQGWASDAHEVMGTAKVLLAPLRFGAGLKGKLIVAMQTGTPSITSAIGAEGMPKNLEWSGSICNDPIAFAKAAIALYTNSIEWDRAQQNGMKIINRHFNKAELSVRLGQRLKSIQENLGDHRTKNLIGAMLRHQSMAAKKYMAKWIEEKNRDNR